METGYKVGDCMTIHPITVSNSININECAKIMRDKHVGSVLVQHDGLLTGLVTEQDLVRNALALGKNPESTTVEEIMIHLSELITISPEKDLFEALTIMRDYNIRHLPVMDKSRLVGFLTIKDILKIQPQLFEIIAEKYELREESRKPVLGSDVKDDLCSECGEISDDLEEIDGRYLCASCRGESGAEPEEEEEY